MLCYQTCSIYQSTSHFVDASRRRLVVVVVVVVAAAAIVLMRGCQDKHLFGFGLKLREDDSVRIDASLILSLTQGLWTTMRPSAVDVGPCCPSS